jgi:hypothetical protein
MKENTVYTGYSWGFYSFPGFIFVGSLCAGAHVHMIVHIISVNERFCLRGGGEVACDADSVY